MFTEKNASPYFLWQCTKNGMYGASPMARASTGIHASRHETR